MEITATQIQALERLREAIHEMGASSQYDLECGVRWMNEKASANFIKKNPALHLSSMKVHKEMDTVEQLFNLSENY